MLAFNEYNCGRLFAEATDIIFKNVRGLSITDAANLAYLLATDEEIRENAQFNEVGLRALWHGTKGFFGNKSDDLKRAGDNYDDIKKRTGMTGKNDPRWFKGARDWWGKLRMLDADFKDQSAAGRHKNLLNRQAQLQALHQQYIDNGVPEDQIPDEVKNWKSTVDYDWNPIANRGAATTDAYSKMLRTKAQGIMGNTWSGRGWGDEKKLTSDKPSAASFSAHYNFKKPETQPQQPSPAVQQQPQHPHTIKFPQQPSMAAKSTPSQDRPWAGDFDKLNTTVNDLAAQVKSWSSQKTAATPTSAAPPGMPGAGAPPKPAAKPKSKGKTKI